MKNIIKAVLFLLCSTIISCKKEENKKTVNIDYSLEGVSDITDLSNWSTITHKFKLSHIAGDKENVTFSVTGLPVGVYENVIIKSDSVSIAYSAKGAATGIYPIEIVATSTSGVKRNATFNLSIVSRRSLLLGTWVQIGAGSDANKNDTVDSDELYFYDIVNDGTINTLLDTTTLNEDGTVKTTKSVFAALRVWGLRNDDKDLIFIGKMHRIDMIDKKQAIISTMETTQYGEVRQSKILKKVE